MSDGRNVQENAPSVMNNMESTLQSLQLRTILLVSCYLVLRSSASSLCPVSWRKVLALQCVLSFITIWASTKGGCVLSNRFCCKRGIHMECISLINFQQIICFSFFQLTLTVLLPCFGGDFMLLRLVQNCRFRHTRLYRPCIFHVFCSCPR